MTKQNLPKEKKSSQDNYPEYVKYIGLAFQMCAIIGLGTWLGWIVQDRSQMKFPVWLLLFCFVSIVVAFYSLFKSMKKD
ncbi:AtpZ/AtpI family protein [Echinicola sp. CAU 1574]|uniref:AtpZ/AtpI family protein n=1 Tax=Echinicola arenosa TaxID=2774144 RepID=A0ABR9AHI9_9BACT|nr:MULTISPECIES: AtpZ/AtpI family protein [Echinicola]MBD8488322.1 AtpZ/AtpI family protein [Echinicola arenosa]